MRTPCPKFRFFRPAPRPSDPCSFFVTSPPPVPQTPGPRPSCPLPQCRLINSLRFRWHASEVIIYKMIWWFQSVKQDWSSFHLFFGQTLVLWYKKMCTVHLLVSASYGYLQYLIYIDTCTIIERIKNEIQLKVNEKLLLMYSKGSKSSDFIDLAWSGKDKTYSSGQWKPNCYFTLVAVVNLLLMLMDLGPVLLTLLRHVARILANGRAAFFESCDAIGWNSCDVSQKR